MAAEKPVLSRYRDRMDKAVADFLQSDQLSRPPAGSDGWSTTAIGAAIAERL